MSGPHEMSITIEMPMDVARRLREHLQHEPNPGGPGWGKAVECLDYAIENWEPPSDPDAFGGGFAENH